MIIDERLKEIIAIIEDLGHQTLIVGGAVRNHLLNREITDYDLATSAKIKDLSQVFLNSTMIYRKDTPWALKINHKGFRCEISTFRVEQDYQDRIPQKIIYVDNYKDDVVRRDFTINALAYTLNNEVLDYCGGLDDLNNQLVKSIKDPQKSFLEDSTRILRGLRLAATLNFTIEKETLRHMQNLYKDVLTLNIDIISKELRKIIGGGNFDYVYSNFQDMFLKISDGQFQNLPLKNREVLLLDEVLYTYLKFKLSLDDKNPIYTYLGLSQSSKLKVIKIKDIILALKNNLDKKSIEVLFIDYGYDKVVFTKDLLEKVDLISLNNIKSINQILEQGYFKISDLKISAQELDFIPLIKERYKILKTLQKMVVKEKIKNEKNQLLKKANDLFNKEKA